MSGRSMYSMSRRPTVVFQNTEGYSALYPTPWKIIIRCIPPLGILFHGVICSFEINIFAFRVPTFIHMYGRKSRNRNQLFDIYKLIRDSNPVRLSPSKRAVK